MQETGIVLKYIFIWVEEVVLGCEGNRRQQLDKRNILIKKYFPELGNLQYRETRTADVRRTLSSKKKFAGNKSDGLAFRSNASEPNAKFTTGFREDIKYSHKEYVLTNGEARNNDLEHHVVKKRRFKRNNRDEENTQVVEHDNERKKRKKKKRHHHHLRSKMNKNHNSTRNKKTKRYKNDTKSNNMEEKHNEDKNKKHHHHWKRKINKNNNSTRNKKTKLYKNEDRNLHKDKKRNKKKNHSGKRNRDKHHSKYSEHPKNKSHKRKKDHIDKKKQHKHKSEDKERDNSMDLNKHATGEGPMTVSKMGMIRLSNQNDHKHKKTRELNKSEDKQTEKSMDRNKHSTTESMRISKMDLVEFANPNDHKHNKKQELSISMEKERKKSTQGVDPKLQPEHVLTSTTTSKPTPESVQDKVKMKLIKRERLKLMKKEKIRVTRMIPFSLKKQEDKGKLRQQSERSESPSAGSPLSFLSPYAIKAQMELLMKEFPQVNATVTKAGRTVEYNDIVLVSITQNKDDEASFRVKESKYADDVPEKKIIFIVHGLTVMGLKEMSSLINISELKLLLSYYFNHLDKFDFFLMPLANPDGFSASLSSAMWNKNVSPQSVCPGVFVDRNFDVAWNTTKEVSSCSQLYPGARAFSEEESMAVRDVFHRFNHKILAYIHVHAGTFTDADFKGEAILYPRGYNELQSDDDKYIDIKGEVDEAMKNASFRVMSVTVDTLSNWYGVVSGTSVDYAATVYGIPYAMEFVMQLYDSDAIHNNALTEIWRRLIDATFNKMWNSQQGGSDTRRF